MTSEMKACPYCAEEIQAEAIKCRFCGEFLSAPPGVPTPAPQQTAKTSPSSFPKLAVVVLGCFGSVVILVILIVAFIAIPQLVDASDRGRQRRTMADMRNIATATGTVRVDTGNYARSLEELQAAGFDVPTTDGWGNAFIYTTGANTYTITSLGSDGRSGPAPPRPWLNAPYDPDIILVDGQFTQAPNPDQPASSATSSAAPTSPATQPSRPAANSSPAQSSVEANLAGIDLGVSSPTNVQIQPYVRLLDQLQRRCTEGRTMIGDMATRATQLIEQDFNRQVTTRFVLQELVDATVGLQSTECSGVIAPLIVLIGKGG